MTTKKKCDVRVRRVYEDAETSDGTRVLVDRVWPRGLSKDKARVDEWIKAVAPSTDLRRWYGHDPDRFEEFARRYRSELAEPEPSQEVDRLRQTARSGRVTLLTATRDEEHSQAVVLAETLRNGS